MGDPASQPIDAAVVIDRDVAAVYAFYQDMKNFPAFLGDVETVTELSPSLYRWTVVGPLGVRLHWDVHVLERRPCETVRFETRVGSLPAATWTTTFAPERAGSTRVREVMQLPLERVTASALSAVGKPPLEEVRANLQRLKEVLETGRVSTLAHAVEGKFDPS